MPTLSLATIIEVAEAIAKSTTDENLKQLAVLIGQLAEGLLRGGGARWPSQ